MLPFIQSISAEDVSRVSKGMLWVIAENFIPHHKLSPENDVQLTVNKYSRTIEELEFQRDFLVRKELQLEKVIDAKVIEIKKLMKAGKKRAAKVVLKSKKLKEAAWDRTCQQTLNLDVMIDMLSDLITNAEVMGSHEKNNEEVRKILKKFDLQKAQDTLDQTKELCDDIEEVNAVVAQNTTNMEYDDGALDDELNAIVNGESMEDLGEVNVVVEQEVNKIETQLKNIQVPKKKVTGDADKEMKEFASELRKPIAILSTTKN